MTMSPKQLLKEAIGLHDSLGAVSRLTGINESTLKRINNGQTERCHAKTLGLLVKATQQNTRKGLTAGKAPATAKDK